MAEKVFNIGGDDPYQLQQLITLECADFWRGWEENKEEKVLTNEKLKL